MMRPSPEHAGMPEEGFTLLELLISITLMAMMAVGLWSVFSISIKSWSRGTEAVDTNQRQRNVLDLATKQLASAYPLYAPAIRRQGEIPSLTFHGTGNGLVFVSLNSLRFYASPGLTLVAYEIVQNENGSFSLVASEQPYKGLVPERESAFQGSDAVTILDNLANGAFEYYDPGDTGNPPQWVSEWDGATLGRMPSAVSVTLSSGDLQGNTRDRRMVVPLQARDSFLGPGGQNRFMAFGRQRGGPGTRRRQEGPGGPGGMDGPGWTEGQRGPGGRGGRMGPGGMDRPEADTVR
ncbi:MAG TPA: prepilin-type N-terminal cleavage/methylation domain-containing protein [Acidobacteriota bacterium]|nr:prepilin-type N-terminal cleavage/methylation domain-containing protein [Acidobacteriota bacterium]